MTRTEARDRRPRWKPRSLRGRLALWFGAVFALVLVAFSSAVYFMVVAEEEHEGDREVEAETEGAGEIVLVALAVGLPAALLVAVSGGLWLSRRALRPIDDVVRLAGAMDAARLTERLPLRPDDAEEVLHLSAALNNMLDRIQHSVEATRRFTADASHELRTPLAVLTGELEIALRRPRQDADLRATLESGLEELGKLSRLVESLLVLARSDSGELPMERKRLDLSDVVREVVEPYEAIAATREVRLSADLPAGLVVDADPLWLGRAIANLVDNACKFTPQGGEISVEVERLENRVRLSVVDSGPPLAPEDEARIFERFYRVDSVRGSAAGSGLGLPLAREIARALGGDLGLARSAHTGNRFWLEMPLAAARSQG
jgi:heavy metal sensor kinase